MAVSLAATVAMAGMAYHLFKSPTTDLLEESHQMCNQKYCPPIYQVWVDKASNTLMRNDRPQTTGSVNSQLAAAYQLVKHTYEREAYLSPGVGLVAHAIA